MNPSDVVEDDRETNVLSLERNRYSRGSLTVDARFCKSTFRAERRRRDLTNSDGIILNISPNERERCFRPPVGGNGDIRSLGSLPLVYSSSGDSGSRLRSSIKPSSSQRSSESKLSLLDTSCRSEWASSEDVSTITRMATY